MSALLLLFVCLLLGVLVARLAKPPSGMVHGINWWVINIALPALVLELIPNLDVDTRLWFPVVAMWITFFGAWLLFALLGRMLGWSRGRIGALTLVCGLCNTAFMGYPMIQALHGDTGLKLAMVTDLLGSFPLLSSVSVIVASLYAGKSPQPWTVARRIFAFPSFLALIVGIVVGALGGWPAWLELDKVLQSLGETLTPLALFSVGLQLRFHLDTQQLSALSIGLAWKLVLAPLVVWTLGRLTQTSGLTLTVGVLQAAMAPMISAAIMADQHELEPALTNTVLSVGIVLSLLTIPLGNLLLSH
ncbi:MAG: AEC family transporter [Rhodanobacter sp.]|jgi:predicted permease|nr:AEC family transporter [Rhodanobacter sp.]